MVDVLNASLRIAGAGMRAQSARLKIISENIANANSTATVKGGDPYRRKIATVTPTFDRELDATLVTAGKPLPDRSDFRSQYDPGNPNADNQGYVKLPNVDSLVEALDLREAQRAYEANLNVIETARSMDQRTLELLKR
jgi:flagellar basal-body rod protein FlgC